MDEKNNSVSFVWRICGWVCLVVGVVFQLIFTLTTFQEINRMQQAIDESALSTLEQITLFIEKKCQGVELASRNVAYMMAQEGRNGLLDLDHLSDRMEDLVELNPVLNGLSIGFEPDIRPKSGKTGKFGFCPYVYVDSQTGETVAVQAGDLWDYREKEYYVDARAAGKNFWSKPTLGNRGELISDYCIPLSVNGRFVGVFAADMNLQDLVRKANESRPFEHAVVSIIDRDLAYVVHPHDTYGTQETLFDRIAAGEIVPEETTISDIREQKTGEAVFSRGFDKIHLFYMPIPEVGWTVLMECSENDSMEAVNQLRKTRAQIAVATILLLFGVCYLLLRRLTRPVLQFSEAAESIAEGNFHTELPTLRIRDELWTLRNSIDSMQKSMDEYMHQLKETSEEKGRFERELQIAREIQMSMIPKIFPPFPDRREIDLCAMIAPAKEVGGDLYDFYIRDEILFFCIGDVSGKGVPASLVMAVTRSLFRTGSAHSSDTAQIMRSINDLMSESNENLMFVTFLLGALNLETGELSYCNAGHNPPLLIGPAAGEVKRLETAPNVPLGVMKGFRFVAQHYMLSKEETLLLYTDGLTEAENTEHALFGEDRLMAVAKTLTGRSSEQQLAEIECRVSEHVGAAEQSDDMTLLTIVYHGKDAPFHLTIRNQLGEVSKLMPFLEYISQETGLETALLKPLNLALEEAVVNVINYAYDPKKKAFIGLDAAVTDTEVRFILTDGGIPFDPTASPSPDLTLDVESRPVGGLGIYMTRQIMDDIRYERCGTKNILRMTKKR